jgi:alpha-L-fucosidase
LLLNVPPDKTGRIPENQVELLMQLKKAIDADASYKSLASGRPSLASSVWGDDHKAYGPQRAFDNDSNTRWTSSDRTGKGWLKVDLGEHREIGQIGLSEAGGHVQTFELQYNNGSGWKTFVKGKEIGYKWQKKFSKPIKARKFRLLITKAKDAVAIWEFRLFEK